MRPICYKVVSLLFLTVSLRLLFFINLCQLLVASLLAVSVAHAQDQLPGDFGPDLHRVASVKSWQAHTFYERTYQWLPDGRLLIWVGKPEDYQPRLFNPRTGKQESLVLFDRLRRSASPPDTGTLESYLSPDGKFTLSLISGFQRRPAFYRTLTLDGYHMHLYPLQRNFAWSPYFVWEWNDHYHGWTEFGAFENYRTSTTMAAIHFDLANPEKPRIVEIPLDLLPAWVANGMTQAFLNGITSTGDGILTPFPGDVNTCPEWIKEHKVPLSLVDTDQGKRHPTNYLISIPSNAEVNTFVISPDTRHIVWHLRFSRPHTIPGQATLYATDEIWVSDLEGSNLHRLGYQAARFKQMNDGLSALAWKDNQNVSFIRNEALYTLPLR